MAASSLAVGTDTIGYQPKGRCDHCTVKIGDSLYMWGGDRGGDLEEDISSDIFIEIFHLLTGKWEQRSTTGNPPLGIKGYSATAIGNHIYYYGGAHDGCYSNSLHCLNVDTLHWKEISPNKTIIPGDNSHPSKKADSRMIAVKVEDEHYLVVIGGSGPIEGFCSQCLLNNDVHLFNLTTCEWSSFEGKSRSRCYNHFSLSSISDNSALIIGSPFGGVSKANVCLGSFYKSSITWEYISKPMGVPIQQESVLITCIPDEPHLLVIGPNYKNCWLVDILRNYWSKLKTKDIPPVVTDKRDYSLSAWNVTPSTVWIVQFGGHKLSSDFNVHVSNETTIIELTYQNKSWSFDTFFLRNYKKKLAIVRSALIPSPKTLTLTYFEPNVACQVISHNARIIKDCHIDLDDLMDRLLEQRIINQKEKQDLNDHYCGRTVNERMDKLLVLVSSSIKFDGSVFGLFLDILKKFDTRRMDMLVKILQKKYDEAISGGFTS